MQTITTRHGETWDMIAYRVYGDEHEMNRLLDANQQMLDVAVFPHGTSLLAPELPEKSLASDDLPPWKR